MDKKLVIKQNGYKDCAVACLVSVMKYYGYNPLYEEVSYLLKVDKNGTNAYNIINGSRSLGFDGYGIHYSADEILSSNITLPIICHVIKDNMYHFIVVYEVKKKYLIIMDPSSNVTKITKEKFKSIYNGTSLFIYPVKKIDNTIKHKTLFEFIFDYLKALKSLIIKSIILSIIITVLSLITSFYLKIFIDKNHNYYLVIITIIFLFITILKNILIYIREKIVNRIEIKMLSYINTNINNNLFNLPYLFFKSKSTSEVESRFDDLSSFKEIINKLISLFINLFFIIFGFIILLSISYKLLLISSLEILLYFIITFIFKRIIMSNSEELLISNSLYKKSLNESINGYETNKNINMINNTIKKNEIKYLSYLNKLSNYEFIINKEFLFKNIITDIMYIIMLFIGIKLVINNEITLGELIVFNSILFYYKEPLKNIFDLTHNISYLKLIYKRINDLFVVIKTHEISDSYEFKKDIIINNLSYSINGIDNIFSNISLRIDYGSKYLIYGKSGNGKSTLMKIILKYLTDYKGEILFENINLKDINSSVIQDNFTYVSQNSYLNNDTIKNNIIYDRDISISEYEEIINICNLNKLRNNSKLRDNFIIEDNGFNISGGEKQKIILARSLLKKSNYIILDEALSEVDINEEIDIINKIIKKYKTKTIIYISHKEELINFFNLKYELERREEV